MADALARGNTARPDPAALWGLARSVLIYHALPWRRRALARFYDSLIGPSSLAFDVGAHVGNRTRTLVALGARCVAIEPQPLFARFLARLFRGDARVTLVTAAVGRAPGRARLAISRRHPTVSTLSNDWIERVGGTSGFERVRWDATVEVPVTTLDALIDEHGMPDFCKIDVEGHEAEILEGLSRPIPLIALEYLPAALDVAERCVARLERLGRYRYNLSIGESHRLALARWVDAEALGAALAKAVADGRSGDLYARLEPVRAAAAPDAVGAAPTPTR